MSGDKTAVVTGASSGIGLATAKALAAAGYQVFLGARRLERLDEAAASITAAGGTAAPLPLDVTDPESIAAFTSRLPARLHLLVNNAGGALGLDRIEDSRDERWRVMW